VSLVTPMGKSKRKSRQSKTRKLSSKNLLSKRDFLFFPSSLLPQLLLNRPPSTSPINRPPSKKHTAKSPLKRIIFGCFPSTFLHPLSSSSQPFPRQPSTVKEIASQEEYFGCFPSTILHPLSSSSQPSSINFPNCLSRVTPMN